MERKLRSFAIAAFAVGGSSPALSQEVLRATGGSSTPYHIVDAAENTQTGIIVDLLNAIGVDAGFTIEYLPARPFAELIPAVAAGEFDTIANNVGITPARQELIDFSVPFHNAAEGLVVLAADETAYASLQDLAGQVVGTLRGSLYEAGLNGMTGVFSEVRAYASIPEVVQAVLSGEIKAGVLSSVPVEYGLAQGQYAGVKLITTGYTPQFSSQLGIVVAKNSPELLGRINTSLTKLMADGTVGRIFADYGITWLAP